MFKWEENVVQAITDNASNYVNVGMRLMEKKGEDCGGPLVLHIVLI